MAYGLFKVYGFGMVSNMVYGSRVTVSFSFSVRNLLLFIHISTCLFPETSMYSQVAVENACADIDFYYATPNTTPTVLRPRKNRSPRRIEKQEFLYSELQQCILVVAMQLPLFRAITTPPAVFITLYAILSHTT